jgi:hypothetical protein
MKKETLLKLINGLLKYDEAIYEACKVEAVNVIDLVNIVYKLYGFEENTYESFRAPAEKSDKPLAWYRTQYNQTNEYITPPKGYGGFIPDAINDVILDKRLTVNKKLTLLNRMFSDLKKIKKGKKNV